MNKLYSTLRGNLRQYVMIIALVVVIIFFQIVTQGVLLKPLNISNIISQNSYVLILAIGMLLCILTGGNVDLSVGSVAGFVGAVSAVFILKMDMPVIWAILISLAIGIAIGAWQGFWIAYMGVPAFIATLAGMLIFRGLTMVILQGTSLAPLPAEYTFIAAGFVPDIANIAGINFLAILSGIIATIFYIIGEVKNRNSKKKYNFEVLPFRMFVLKIAAISLVINAFTYLLSLYKGIPAVLILVVILVLIYSFITTKTIPGRHIYAFGGNPKAAKLSGVKPSKFYSGFMLIWAFSCSCRNCIYRKLNSATPKSGQNFEMDAIASCYIGGASTSGGVGTVIGAIVGGLLMGILNNGMSILGVKIDWQQAIKGFVLLAAVAFDVYSKSKSRTV